MGQPCLRVLLGSKQQLPEPRGLLFSPPDTAPGVQGELQTPPVPEQARAHRAPCDPGRRHLLKRKLSNAEDYIKKQMENWAV